MTLKGWKTTRNLTEEKHSSLIFYFHTKNKKVSHFHIKNQVIHQKIVSPLYLICSLLKKQKWVLDKSWAIAPGEADCPYAGNDRNKLSQKFSCPSFHFTQEEDKAILKTTKLKLIINYSPLKLE